MIIKGQGPTLLLIPGLQGRWEWMAPAVDALASRMRVVTYSLSGEREAVPPLVAGSFDDLVRQALNVLNRATDGPAVVCGVSYGGLIALRLAAQYPQRVRALILASPLGADFTPDARLAQWMAHPRLFAPAFLAGSPGRSIPEIRAARPVDWRSCALGMLGRVLRAPHSPTRMAHRLRLLDGADFVGDCARVAAPTLLLTGERGLDLVVPPDTSCRMLRWLPRATHATLPRTGHFGLVTRSEVFAGHISRFVEAHA